MLYEQDIENFLSFRNSLLLSKDKKTLTLVVCQKMLIKDLVHLKGQCSQNGLWCLYFILALRIWLHPYKNLHNLAFLL